MSKKGKYRESGDRQMQNNAKITKYFELTKKQQEYIRIKSEGNWKESDIAKKIDVNPSTISRWKKDEKFLDGQRGYQAQYLDDHVPYAMRRMVELLDAKSELVSYQAAKDILDRTGYIPVERQEIEHSGGVSFHDDI